MKANTKYTAVEILTEAGFDKPETMIGKFRVVIGGISGIVSADHLIKVIEGTKTLEVTVGVETKTIKIESENEEAEVSEGVRAVLDARVEPEVEE